MADTKRKRKHLRSDRSKRELHLNLCPARVDRVHISGLKRTHEDYLRGTTDDLLKANSFQDVIVESIKAWEHLHDLQIYKDVRVLIDVSKGEHASENGYEVTFSGTELPRMMGAAGTQVGQNEGSMTMQLIAPNIFGRGERLAFNASCSNSKNTDVTIRLSKPFLHTTLRHHKPDFSFGVFRHATAVPISGYKMQNVGLFSEVKFVYPFAWNMSHSIQYELSFREISTLNKQPPFFVSSQCGPRMASLIRYVSSYDGRDNPIFPTRGPYVKHTSEMSGLGGNMPYLMGDLHAEVNYPLYGGISTQIVGRMGAIRSDMGSPRVPISSLFTLGGPLSLRGFQFGGVGPHIDGYATGVASYWATALHFWAPLPFHSYFGRFGNNFKSHLFFNFGNCNSFSMDKIRSAAGFGVAVRLGGKARIECNYCLPIDRQKDDRIQPGIQFGIGCDFI